MHIGTEQTRGFIQTLTKVTTELSEGGARATANIDRTKSAGFAFFPAGGAQVSVKLSAQDEWIAAPAGTKLHQAIEAYERLGAKHGVDGVSIPSPEFDAGGITRAGSGISIAGGDYAGIGRENASALTAAARNVLEALGLG